MPETILTKAARVAFATILKGKPLFLSIAAGNSGWGNNPPNPDINATGLTTTALAWKKAMIVAYCYEDPEEGTITLLDGTKYSLTTTPTESLYLKFTFEPGEIHGFTFREFGVFMDTAVQTGLPPGQLLFTPSQITSPGTLVAIQRRAPVTRDSEIREFFQTVITL